MPRSYNTKRDRGALIIAAALAAAPVAFAQDEPIDIGSTIEETRDKLDRWQDVRRTISKERNNWVLAREVLQARIDLLRRNIEQTREQVEAERIKLQGFGERAAELEAQNEKLKRASEKLERLVQTLEARALTLIEGAPTPLVKEVQPLALQLPGYTGMKKGQASADTGGGAESEAANKTTPIARRVENVVGVLYLFNKYAGKVDLVSEQVQRNDGTTLLVDTLYLGVSYGFYVDAEDGQAAAGWAGPDGWGWSPIDGSAARVREAVQVLNEDQSAAFVPLPVEVK